MKKKYVVNFIIKDSVIIEAESVGQAKRLFIQKKDIDSGTLHIEYIEEFDRIIG